MKLHRLSLSRLRVGSVPFWRLGFVLAAVLQLTLGFQVSSASRYSDRVTRFLQIPSFRGRHSSFLTATPGDSSSDNDSDDDVPEEQDWRAFRARLVQMDRQKNSPLPSLKDDSTDDMTTWAYDAGMNVEVGTVLLSIPTTDLCQALVSDESRSSQRLAKLKGSQSLGD